MSKRSVYRSISVLLTVIALLAIVCAVTVTGGGFLDLSNVMRGVSLGVAALSLALAAVIWRAAKKRP